MIVEVIHWTSIVLLWLATGLNVAVTVANTRLRKRLTERLKEADRLVEDARRLREKAIDLGRLD